MKNLRPYTLLTLGIFSLISMVWASGAEVITPDFQWEMLQPLAVDTPPTPSMPFPFDDRSADPFNSRSEDNPLYLNDPSNINTTIEYDPDERQYNINEMIGNQFYRAPSYMTFEEFKESEFNKSTGDYWKQKANEDNIVARKNPFAPKLYVGGEAFNRIFGGNTIDIRAQGSASLSFGLNISNYENPTLPVNQRKNTTFDFQEKIQMNVIGNIGEKLKISINYNTEASFDFENQVKIEYTGYEDEIIQKIEAGNVSLPLNTTLIQGSQSLFGLKTQLKFGRLTVTALLSQQKGQASNIEVKGGATTTNFDIRADQYESNKHFFLSNYFKDNYDASLSQLPFINSQVSITRLEVWVTNKNNSTDNTRTVLALLDLAETNYYNQNIGLTSTFPFGSPYPSDSTNNLYSMIDGYNGTRDINSVQTTLAQIPNIASSTDYDVVQNARKLAVTEYTFNPRLGFISLNQALNNNEVLGVAFEYTVNGKVYKVGDLTTSGVDPSQVLYLKMLKGRITNTKLPTWDLMMKNIYALGGFQIDKKDFHLDVLYYVDTIGNRLNYLPVFPSETNLYTTPLNKVYNLDELNANNDPRPDGEFDFVEGVTINSSNGRVIFPVREPFGSYLNAQFISQSTADQFVFQILYDSTKTVVLQNPENNKFSLKGSYTSKFGSDIPLNAINIPEGSVKVTAGGAQLVENVDYTVDYNLGRVKIINQSILNSGTAINIALESNSLFSIQSKTLLGSRFDYVVNKDLVLGGTILRLNERPITSKVNIGDEPIANTMLGIDGNWRTQSRWLTRAIDKLPGISTKEISTITVYGEAADLIPGNNKAIGKEGTAYIDDFEGSQSTIDLTNVGTWLLSSTPSSQIPGADSSTLANGFNRAKMSWFRIDPLFYRNTPGVTPPYITATDISNQLVRQITEQEIFPNKEIPNGGVAILPMFNVSYYPQERGPYNYDVLPTPVSAGVAPDGTLNDPASRWAGIMRRVETTDFDAANVEFIQFWLMDPFNADALDPNSTGGNLYFNLGNVSEDILKDGKLSYENGLPIDGDTTQSTNTIWGYVPKNQPPIIYAFDNNAGTRQYQDVGLDGLKNDNENVFFQDYLDELQQNVASAAFVRASLDVSSDNYHYYRGSDYDALQTPILDCYKNFSLPDGNSPTDEQSPESYSTAATTLPDAEDANKDFNQEASEQFYEYKVTLDPTQMVVGKNYIVDKITRNNWPLPDGTKADVTWYQYKIPIRDVNGVNPNATKFGDIDGFNTISFIRMFMTGFQAPMVLRFAKLEFLRGEWRKYTNDLYTPGECLGCGSPNTSFDLTVVNLEENGDGYPIPYVLPPGIEREINVGSPSLQQLNEQSLAFDVCELQDGDARGAFKTLQLDLRSYKTLRMYIHAQALGVEDALKNGDLYAFVRMGDDFTDNYYEYQIPLVVTPWGTVNPGFIWPEENLLNLELDKFVNLKLARNDAVKSSNGTLNIANTYTLPDGNNFITIRGNPTLSAIRNLMLGVRNPQQNPLNPGTDDGNPKCGEIWMDELRLTNFDKKGGWAATSRATAKLADIGNVTVAGTYKSIGFGAIEQKISERRRSSQMAFDVSSSLYLGKFLPEKAAMDIPMYVNYGTIVDNPEYDPLNQDVPFSVALDDASSKSEKKEIKNRSQDYTMHKSINFTNVKKNRLGGAKPKVYDIENFNVTYGYEETYHRDINIQYDIIKTHRAALGYNYNATPKYISPFGKSPGLKSKYVRAIKDFNFNFVPSSLNFRSEVLRSYGEKLFRNNTGYADLLRDTFYDKNFELRRNYDFKFDLTKSIKLDFNANNYSVVDQPEGNVSKSENRDSVNSSLWGKTYWLGRSKQYTQAGSISYQVPLNKFPLTDWISLNAKYGFTYNWTSGAFILNPTTNSYGVDPRTGNTIQNANTKSLNGNFTMTTLYNKVPFFKKVNSPKPKPTVAPKTPKPDIPKTPADTAGGKKPVAPTVIKPPPVLSDVVRFGVKLVLSVKTLGFTYSTTNGTMLPGYVNYSQLMGQDLNNNSPGLGFAFGSQKDIRTRAVTDNWITTDTSLNNPYAVTYTENFTARGSVEPVNGLKIELTANRTYAKSNSEFFKYNGTDFTSTGYAEMGNFSISIISLRTAFSKDNSVTYSSPVFEQFSENRQIYSERYAAENPNSVGFNAPDTFGVVYNDGYSGVQQEVLTMAFLSAYEGKSPDKVGTNPFLNTPLPNWRINYDGLSKISFFKKIFNNVNLTHSYRSTFNINSFNRDPNYISAPEPIVRDVSGNFIPAKQFTQISIIEQFAPLLGIDITWKNNIQTRIEFKRDRNVSMTFAGVQVTETKGNEITFGFGYRIPKFILPFGLGGTKGAAGNSLNLTADFSARKNITVIHRLLDGVNQPTAGLDVYSIKGAADYSMSERVNIRLFYEQTINTPVISTSYPTSNINAGVELRFSLSQ